jgi:hypothetical protein
MPSDKLFFYPARLLAFLCMKSGGEPGEVVEEWHALLPVEKKLISYCLIIAAMLLVLLVWISYTYFRVGK